MLLTLLTISWVHLTNKPDVYKLQRKILYLCENLYFLQSMVLRVGYQHRKWFNEACIRDEIAERGCKREDRNEKVSQENERRQAAQPSVLYKPTEKRVPRRVRKRRLELNDGNRRLCHLICGRRRSRTLTSLFCLFI